MEGAGADEFKVKSRGLLDLEFVALDVRPAALVGDNVVGGGVGMPLAHGFD